MCGGAHLSAFAFFLPSDGAVEESSASGLRTPDDQLDELDAQAWSELEALLREASVRRDWRTED